MNISKEKASLIREILSSDAPKKEKEKVPYIERFKARFTFWYTAFCFFLVGSLVFVEIPEANKDTLITLTGILIGSGLIMILAHWFKRVVDQLQDANKTDLEEYKRQIEELLEKGESSDVSE